MPIFIQRETPDDDAIWNSTFQGRRYTIVIEGPFDLVKAAAILAELDEMYKKLLKKGAVERDLSERVGLSPLDMAHAIANGGPVTEVPRD